LIDVATWRCARGTAVGNAILGKDDYLAFDEVFESSRITADSLVTEGALNYQEGVGPDPQRSDDRTPPTSPLITPKLPARILHAGGIWKIALLDRPSVEVVAACCGVK
jgi:hypothetical protein